MRAQDQNKLILCLRYLKYDLFQKIKVILCSKLQYENTCRFNLIFLLSHNDKKTFVKKDGFFLSPN